jgi:hypothetical protein
MLPSVFVRDELDEEEESWGWLRGGMIGRGEEKAWQMHDSEVDGVEARLVASKMLAPFSDFNVTSRSTFIGWDVIHMGRSFVMVVE